MAGRSREGVAGVVGRAVGEVLGFVESHYSERLEWFKEGRGQHVGEILTAIESMTEAGARHYLQHEASLTVLYANTTQPSTATAC